MLTKDALREHIKLDAGDQDALLDLYAAAAISAAERYTLRPLKPGRITDIVQTPNGQAFRLSGTPNDVVVARVYIGGAMQQYICRASGKMVTLPVYLDCGVSRLELEYTIGPKCPSPNALVDTDPMIELGILKFVAHAFQNRGDDPNCWAADSGAAGMWRAFKPINFG